MLRRWRPDFTRTRTSSTGPSSARRSSSRCTLAGTRRGSRPCGPASEGLGLASASQVYPRLLNGDSIVRLAEQVAAETSERLALPGTPASATPVAAAA